MKKRADGEALITLHISPDTLWCSVIDYAGSYRFHTIWQQALPLGTLTNHIYRMHQINSCIESIKKIVPLDAPWAFCFASNCLQEAITDHRPHDVHQLHIDVPISATHFYSGALPYSALFQWQLVCINHNLQCLVITSCLRAYHAAVTSTFDTENNITSLSEYQQALERAAADEDFFSIEKESHNQTHFIEAIGLYQLGTKVYESF